MVKQNQDLLRYSAVEKVTVADPCRKAKRPITRHTVKVTEQQLFFALGVLPILPKLPHFAPTFISKAPKKERERNGKEEAFSRKRQQRAGGCCRSTERVIKARL
jgi:hypothetical protein